MSSELFEKSVKKLNRKFGSVKSMIALITDNFTAHAHAKRFEWIKLFFLQPSTTPHTQPMDQGITCKLVSVLEKKERISITSIFSAMIILGKTWKNVVSEIRLLQTTSKRLAFLRKKWKECLMMKMIPSPV